MRKSACFALIGIAAVAITPCSSVEAQSYRSTYDYDPRGRLTSVTYENLNASGTVVGAARSIAFSYDKASNRTAVVSTAPTVGNHAPFAGDDAYVAIPEVLLEFNVLWNDNDLNGDKLYIANVWPPGGPLDSYQAWTDGNRVFFKANPSAAPATQPYTLTYRVTDGALTADASIRVSIDEIMAVYCSGNYCGAVNDCGYPFTGLDLSGMRDWNFGTSPPIRETTIHLTSTSDGPPNTSARQIFAWLGPGPVVVSRLAIAPIHNSYPDVNVINHTEDHFLTAYIQYSADGINWFGSDENIVTSPVNNYLQIDMDEILAQWVVITMSRPGAFLGVGDLRVFGIGTNNGSSNGGGGLSPMSLRAFPDGERRFVAPAVMPRGRPARFANLLPPLRPIRFPGQIVETPVGASGSDRIPPSLDPEPPPTLLASLPGSGQPPPQRNGSELREQVPVSYFSSSQLTIAGALDGDGLRDGRFSGDSSVLRTSTSSSEFLVAEFREPRPISRIDVAPVDGEDPYRLQGASIFTSADCQRWTWLASLGELKTGAYTSIAAQGVEAKCVKVEMRGNYLAVGDLRVY